MPCQQPRVGLYRNAVGVTGLQAGHRHPGCQQPRRALEEHQAHRYTVKLLRADGARQRIALAPVLAVPRRPAAAIVIQRAAKAGPPEPLRQAHVVCPLLGPTDVADEAACLSKGEVQPRNPGAGPFEERFKRLETLQAVERTGFEVVTL